MMRYIDFDQLREKVETYTQQYQNAAPFELLVIDNFLTDWGLEQIDVERLSSNASSNEKSSDYFFAKEKIENPNLSKISKALDDLKKELISKEFADFLSSVTCKDLFVDEKFVGGGLHQGGKGSFLEMHADFSRHPEKREWIRELNLLLYLNKDWKPEYGGSLDLQNAHTGETKSIEPIENRFVVMLTKEHTIHGYKPINFPPGSFRTSIAAYAYTLDDGTQHVPYRSTTWHPQDTKKTLAAAILNKLVPIKQKIFGSRTAKRSKD